MMWKMDYVDSLAIVDKNFKILHSYRCNPRFDEDLLENLYMDYIDKNFYEVYPQLSQSESSMYEAIKNNRIVYNENQIFVDYRGRVFNTRNLTIPIVREGEVVAAIELSKDITSIDDLDKIHHQEGSSHSIGKRSLKIESLSFDDILTNNYEMIENIRMAKIFARSPSSSLIYGETGTGKELFVQSMVNYSGIKREKFVALNCAAVPENLMESILFGSVKGVFTGADNRIGIFEQADQGIVFLDELNSMPIQIQAKLLRVLQDGVVRKLGSEKEKRVDVKVIGAMNCDPLDAIEKGWLREDLFYRLSSNLMRLIPLRERREDVPLYVEHFIKELNAIYSKEVEGISGVMMDVFMTYDWKGNVREIKHILESMISITGEKILTIKHLPLYMKGRITVNKDDKNHKKEKEVPTLSLSEAVDKTERELIVKALVWTN
jgi:arginine utilization regulatory protein